MFLPLFFRKKHIFGHIYNDLHFEGHSRSLEVTAKVVPYLIVTSWAQIYIMPNFMLYSQNAQLIRYRGLNSPTISA